MYNKKYYILLAYYKSYFPSALALYQKFRNSIDGLQLVVVDNSEDQFISEDYPFLTVVKGDNSVLEFSGWQSAIERIFVGEDVSDEDLFIFANDTISKHRYFTFIDRMLFVGTLKKADKGEIRHVIGEVNLSKKALGIDGCSFNKWISTYLFAVPGLFLKEINKDLTFGVTSKKYISEVTQENIEYTDFVSSALSSHINDWLFPKKGSRGWYNSSRSPAHKKAMKSLSILCEKKLSAVALERNFKIYDIYEAKLARKYRRKSNRLFRRIKRL